MADGIQHSISGLDSVLGKLESVKVDVRKRGGRFAMRKAANLVAEAAKNNAAALDDPATSDFIKKNIAVRFSSRLFKTSGDIGFRVGIMGGARAPKTETDGDGGRPGGTTFHWRFLEFGTTKQRATPFFRRALSDNTRAATDEFVNHYGRALDRAIKRAAKGK